MTLTQADDLPTRLHPLSRGRARLVALGLFVGTFALLSATSDMGYSRDESFYFAYAETYQEWFVGIEQADTPEATAKAFGRDATLAAWAGNFEHPPLMKVLFGFAWRAFARKDRHVGPVHADHGALTFDVYASKAVGFDEGADVVLLAPQAQGMDPTDASREVARGVVVKREADRAVVKVAAEDVTGDAAAIVAQCAAAASPRGPPEALPIAPCQGREDRALSIMSEATAFRLPGILSGALAVMLTFLLGVELFGWLVGLFGSLLFIFVPEHFYHAHLCAFDMPITAATLFVFYAFWRSLKDPHWALVAAIAWGTALLTKHNAFFIPVPLIFWWLWTGRDRLRFQFTKWRLDVRLPPLPRALLVMPVIALCMLFAFWPKLWIDPLNAVRDYFAFHLSHEHYMQYWNGEPLQVPPFPLGYPFAKSFYTYSEIFIFMLVVGAFFLAPVRVWWAWLRGLVQNRPVSPTERVAVFVLVAGLVPIAIISIPSTPIFGGIKHWMPGAPFLALIAAYGLFRLLAALRIPRWATIAIACLCIAHPAKASIEHTWVGSCYYNSLFAGGLQGAADKRLMRAFWGHSTQEAVDWLNKFAPLNARVFWQDTTWGAYNMYQLDGRLRHDIRYANGPHGAQIALIDCNQAFWELDVETRKALGVAGPDWIVTKEGVPYLFVYVRPGALAATSLDDRRRPSAEDVGQ